MPRVRPPRLFLFDIDGTLLSGRDPLAVQALDVAIVSCMGFVGTPDDIPHAGYTDLRTLVELGVFHGLDVDESRQRAELALQRKDAVYALLMAGAAELPALTACPGALSFVTAVRDLGITIGIASGNTPYAAKVKLERSGFDPGAFAVAGYGHRTIDRADMIRAACIEAALLLPDLHPSEVVMVGDTPSDIEAARAVGTRVIAVATGRFGVEDLRDMAPDIATKTLGLGLLTALGLEAPVAA